MAIQKWQVAKREAIISIVPNDFDKARPFKFSLNERFLCGGRCSIRFSCKCGKEVQLENLEIMDADRNAQNQWESEHYWTTEHDCACGEHYQIETASNYDKGHICFLQGHIPDQIYVRIDYKAKEFRERVL